jgi:hypothetical protein
MVTAVSAFLLGPAPAAHAHCDGLDGPVVGAAREALESGNVNLALVWVQKDDEAEVSRAFERALASRRNAETREAADTRFFETLVRVHRAGEGAAYTGLKPAGRDLGPAVPAADRAIASGQPAELREIVLEAVEHGLDRHFGEAAAKKGYDRDDVAAGRQYIASYVEYVHWVERLYEAAASAGHGEHEEHVD